MIAQDIPPLPPGEGGVTGSGQDDASVGNGQSLPAAAGTVPAMPQDAASATLRTSSFVRSLAAVAGPSSTADDSRVIAAVEEYLRQCEAGTRPSVDDFVAAHSEIATKLGQCLAGLEFVQAAVPDIEASTAGIDRLAGFESLAAQPLGDYQIIRELGRGGMGIVYEAEQLSLARRVALKVLPFAAMLDPRHLQRFKNEALAAAHLDHPNIVEVYGVGCERGIHFYAMRYVEGQTLAAVIEGLKDDVRSTKDESKRLTPRDDQCSRHTPCAGQPHTECADYTDTFAAVLSTLRTTKPRDFFCTVAELGIQAAEALDHAHQMGIVHRDIKPSNLMIEVRSAECGARGAECGVRSERHSELAANSELRTPNSKLYITDFGLAHIESDATLTMTGDLLGTLRYMSPEQALGKRMVVDHRTDIYSLGITLYELLTSRPAFDGINREEVLHQIASKEPTSPRKLNAAIPLDLETVIRKAIEKNSHDRYQTARDLADDLRRYLKDEPIRAKAPGAILRVRKWSRRHKEFVAAAALILVLISIVSTISSLVVTDAYRAEARHRQLAEDNLDLALEALDAVYLKAIGEEKLLRERGTSADFASGTKESRPLSNLERELLKRGLDFYDRFAQRNDGSADASLRTAQAYYRVAYIHAGLRDRHAAQTAFRTAIAKFESLVAEDPKSSDTYRQLAESYSALAFVLPETGEERQANLEKARTALTSALALEPNSHRLYLLRGDMSVHMRDVAQARADYEKAIELGADDPELLRQSADRALWSLDRTIVERLAARAVEVAPNDAQCHLTLAYVLGHHSNKTFTDDNKVTVTYEMRDPEPVLKHYAKAIELDPKLSAVAFAARAGFYQRSGDFDSALSDIDRALALRPDEPTALFTRAKIYRAQGKYDDALTTLAQLMRTQPNVYEVPYQIGEVQMLMGRYQDAVKSLSEAIEYNPGGFHVYKRRAMCFARLGDHQRALADLKTCLEINPNDLGALQWIPRSLWDSAGKFHEGLLSLAETVVQRSNNAFGYLLRGELYADLNEHEKAGADFRKAIELASENVQALNHAAWTVVRNPRSDAQMMEEALAWAQKAVERFPNAAVWNTLGVAQYRVGDWQQCIGSLKKSEELAPGQNLAFNAFFLAMAHWQLANKDEARQAYDQAIEWMAKNAPHDDELRRFRAEAEQLVGVQKSEAETQLSKDQQTKEMVEQAKQATADTRQ